MASKEVRKTNKVPAASKEEASGEAAGYVGRMIAAYLRGSDKGDVAIRAAKLVESLWTLSQFAEDDRVRLAATKELMDRVDGKVVERKEIRSMKIEGIVYLPEAIEMVGAIEVKDETKSLA
jgi:hypothetical protein